MRRAVFCGLKHVAKHVYYLACLAMDIAVDGSDAATVTGAVQVS